MACFLVAQGVSVTFDASLSSISSSSATNYYLFQFGDTDAAGTAQTQLVSQSGPPSAVRVTHTYTAPGTYTASLVLSDAAFSSVAAIQGPLQVSTTAGGYGAPAATVVVVVKPSFGECYPFTASLTWNATCVADGASDPCALAAGTVTVNIQAIDPAGVLTDLPTAFSAVGDGPSVSMSNLTHAYVIADSSIKVFGSQWWTCTATSGKWAASFDASIFTSAAPVPATIRSNKSAIMGCTMRDTRIDLTVPLISHATLGFDMSSTVNGVKAAASLATQTFQPKLLRIAQNLCKRSQTIAIFSAVASPSFNSLGALVASSPNQFATSATLWDLTRDSAGSSAPSSKGSLCGSAGLSAAQCQELTIVDALIVDNRLLFTTSAGLFISTAIPLFVSGPLPSALSYTRITSGFATVDSPAASTSLFKIQLLGSSTCLAKFTGRVFVLLPSAAAATSPIDTVAYALTVMHFGNATFATVSVAALRTALPTAGITAAHSFVSARYDEMHQRNIYLLGVAVSSACLGRRCPYNTPIVVLHNTDAGTFSTGSGLPAATVVTGMQTHGISNVMYVFGSEVWVSQDAGSNWLKQFELDQGNAGSEVLVEMQSALASDESIVFLSSAGRVFYGMILTAEFVLVRTVPPIGTAELASLASDGKGGLSVVWTEAQPAYGGASTAYPSGFLADSMGTLRKTILNAVPISRASTISPADDSFGSTLAPVFLSATRVRVYVVSPATSNYFRQHHRGWQISHKNGGAVVIRSIAADGMSADCEIATPLVPETATQSPAIAASLTVSGLSGLTGDVTTLPLISTTVTPQTVTLTLTSLGGSGVGWMFSDIGKTVVVNYAAIVITAVASTTSATGSLIQKPNMAAAAASLTVATGAWAMYDFRPSADYATTVTQSISLSVSGTAVTVTLAAGEMSFSAQHTGMILSTAAGWGVVQYVTSATVAVASAFQTFGSATYAAGSWHLYATRPEYTLGAAFPDARQIARTNNAIALNVAVTLSDVLGMPQAQVVMQLSNSATSNLTIGPVAAYPEQGRSLSAVIGDENHEGHSLMLMHTTGGSLKCPPSYKWLRMIHGCAPTRYIGYDLPVSKQDFLSGAGMTGPIPVTTALPANYRPPSSLGYNVPTSNNIYNADPQQPMYRTRFQVSRTTGAYKQCAGQPTRSACGCTDVQRLSMKEANSDCIDRVLNVLYSQPFVPNITTHEYNAVSTVETGRYLLKELNGRVDWCFTYCSNRDLVSTTPFDPSRDTIQWSGGELYHFRATIMTDEYCDLSAEFMVFVALKPPPKGLLFVSVVVTCTAVGLVLFFLYIRYASKRQ
nr:hypothetical protein HK105_008004 [Polyrhizophydium stewartii]